MFGGTLCVALSYMLHARIEPKFDTIPARLLVMFLAFVQPLVRGWSRYFTWLQFKRTPAQRHRARTKRLPAGSRVQRQLARRSYWNEDGQGSPSLARLDLSRCSRKKAGAIPPTPAGTIGTFRFTETSGGASVLQTVTEYHGGPKCLTRVGLRYRFVTTTVIINLVLLSLLVYQQLNAGHAEPWLIGVYAGFLLYLGIHARRLKHRVAELVDLAAYRAGLQRIKRRTATAPVDATKTASKAEIS